MNLTCWTPDPVMMQGEPLHNYDSVLASIDILAEVRTLSKMLVRSLK